MYSADGTTHSGYVLSCGTGIEGCSIFSNFGINIYFECLKDPRRIWRSLTIGIDLSGKRIQSRMDNQQDNGVNHTAAEYVFKTADGGHVLVTDETMGIGFVKIKTYDGQICQSPYGGLTNFNEST